MSMRDVDGVLDIADCIFNRAAYLTVPFADDLYLVPMTLGGVIEVNETAAAKGHRLRVDDGEEGGVFFELARRGEPETGE